MKITSSIIDGNWESILVWDNGIPDLNDIVIIQNNITINNVTHNIQNLYITNSGYINIMSSAILNVNNLIIVGVGINCQEGSKIQCNGNIISEKHEDEVFE